MAYPKLFTLIDAIDLKQVNTLRKYILSKVSEQSEAYQILETIIKTKDKREKYPDAESMQIAFYPKIKIKTFINYLSLLYSYAEDWIALAQMEVDEYSKDLLVQRWLNNNGLYSLSDQLVKKVLKKIETSEGLDINDAKVKAELLYEHLFSTNPSKYEFNQENYLSLISAFNEYSIAKNFLLICELCNLGKRLHKSFDNEINPTLRNLNYYMNNELVLISNSVYNLINEENLEDFILLKDYLLNSRIRKNTRLHLIICNYLIQKSVTFTSRGLITEKKLIYDLTKYGLENGVFLDSGKLATTTFHNLIVRLSFHSSYKEIEEFIHKWINKVNTLNYEATLALAKAQNCLYNYKFEEVSKYAWRGDFDNFNQKILAQGMLLISSFMNRFNDSEFFKSTMKATNSIIERNKNKLTDHNYKSYFNLIRFIKDLDKNDGKKIFIEDYLPIYHRIWCEFILKE